MKPQRNVKLDDQNPAISEQLREVLIHSDPFIPGAVTALFDDLESDIVDWIVDPASGDIAVGLSMPNETKYHYTGLGMSTAKAHMRLARSFKSQQLNIASSTANGSHLLLHVSSDVNPGEYYFFDTTTNKANFLWANLSWIDPAMMRPMNVNSFKASDGTIIPVQVTRPTETKSSPLVVMIHGGPHGVADLRHFDSEVQLLVNRGYTVLQVNFRGSGNFGNKFLEAGYQQWGGQIIDDIKEATDWAVKTYALDATRICAYGASFGGYAATMLAAKYPDLLRCAIGYVGVYDLNLMYTVGDIPLRWGGEQYLKKVLGQNAEQLTKYSPITHARNIKANIMLIHGSEDIRAPIEHAEAMKDALESANKPVQWLVYGKAGHGVWDLKDRRHLYSELLSFLADNLQSTEP